MLYVDDPRSELAKLLEARRPTYAAADLTVRGGDAPVSAAAEEAERLLVAMGFARPADADA